ncbi:hypothetical protein FRB96_001961 [Tulasnella sp. 330]|nr:hypothetical protein FRB96_001961 [Tulasnella sp. 330]KAG8869965.1 hypothetical protein FRB97_000562 [Tulasnella sp. 331]
MSVICVQSATHMYTSPPSSSGASYRRYSHQRPHSIPALSPSSSSPKIVFQQQQQPHTPTASQYPSPSSKKNSSPSAAAAAAAADHSRNVAESISKLAALPSLSKSLNHLPALGPNDTKGISVYEGMPSRAQATSHEKLKLALGLTAASGKDKASTEKNGFYSNPQFGMTPMNTPVVRPRPLPSSSQPGQLSNAYPLKHQKQGTFSLYEESEDDDEDAE